MQAKEDEETPLRPARLEMAPHARLGLKVSVGFAMSTLLLLHGSIVVVGFLNYDAVCEFPLAKTLVWYGFGGLLFVLIFARGWCFFSQLGPWPDRFSAFMGLLTLIYMVVLGVYLTIYTKDAHDSCRLSAPILYRWCFATSLFFVILVALVLFVPFLRLFARCLIAPIAFCLVMCVDTLRAEADVEVPEVELPELGKFQMPSVDVPDTVNFGASTMHFGVFAKCVEGLLALVIFPIWAILEAGRLLFMAIMSGTLLVCGGGWRGIILIFQACCFECSTPHAVLHCVAQTAIGAGCLAPGRSLIALFVNTAALLWFFIYFIIEVVWNWGLPCDLHVAGLGPSPLHSFVLAFGASGAALTVISFLYDIFVPPLPPPRSQLEAATWRSRRRARIVGYIFLLTTFLILGAALAAYTITSADCSALAPAVYRMAWLIVLIWASICALVLILLFLTCLDCCITGRLRLVVILTNKHYEHAQPSDNVAAVTGTLDPDGDKYFVGATAGDVERVYRDGDEVDRFTNWTVDTNYGERRDPPARAAGRVGAGAASDAPSYSSMDR